MRTRSAEVLLCKEVRSAAKEWVRNSQSENPGETLRQALDKWLSLQETREDQMLAAALASMLQMKVSAAQSEVSDPDWSETPPDEEPARRRLDICAQCRHRMTQLQKGERGSGENPMQTLTSALMSVSATKMRQMLSELRPWLRSWLRAELASGARAVPSLADST